MKTGSTAKIISIIEDNKIFYLTFVIHDIVKTESYTQKQ